MPLIPIKGSKLVGQMSGMTGRKKSHKILQNIKMFRLEIRSYGNVASCRCPKSLDGLRQRGPMGALEERQRVEAISFQSSKLLKNKIRESKYFYTVCLRR